MAKREGVWFLVEFDSNRGALCKSKGHKSLDLDARNQIVGSSKKLEVEICYDFFGVLRPVPVGQGPNGQPIMGLAREPVVTGNHFLLEDCPVYVNMALASKVTFLDDMKQFDRNQYDKFIEHAFTNLEAQRKEASPLHFVDNPKDARLPVQPGGAIDLSKLRT